MPLSVYSDEYFMKEAYKQAVLAMDAKEVPVGAVITCNNRVIAKAHNQVETLTDATAHAEIMAITSAEATLGSKYLMDCTLYVTLEPCVMCAGALYWAQLSRVVYAAADPGRGFSRLENSGPSGKKEKILHPKTSITSGVMAEECSALVSRFFAQLRDR